MDRTPEQNLDTLNRKARQEPPELRSSGLYGLDATRAIARNRDMLLRLVATLFGMAGVAPGGTIATLPRQVRCSLLRLLRPAESAVRRLIVAAAQELPVPPAPVPSFGQGTRTNTPRAKRQRLPSFALCDRALRIGGAVSPRYAGVEPRISIVGFDTSDRSAKPVLSPDDLVSAERLSQRLEAMRHALDDLPKQAQRLARWRARRRGMVGRLRVSPLRLGRPPGSRARARHPLDSILSDCHELALYAMAPDTS